MAGNLVKLILPKKQTKGGVSYTPTFNPAQPLLSRPTYQEHLTDLYQSRQINDSRALLNTLVNQDPDVSAAVHAFLSIAESADLVVYAYDANGQLDLQGIQLANQILEQLTIVYDYSTGYSNKPLLSALCNDMRYYLLLRGMIAGELVFDKQMIPSEIRLMDSQYLWWNETAPGVYDPFQKPRSGGQIDLNIPTFFVTRFHQNPTDVNSHSAFVSAINTIAARTEVINELYRIMRVVGYPRLDVAVLEDVLSANAPVTIRQNPEQLRNFVEKEIAKIAGQVSGIRSDQAFVHSNAVEAKIINDKNPGAGMQIQQVIDVLDAQNQAALKVMPAVIGKADGGQVASTEARLFALGCDALNRPVAEYFTKALTLAARLAGYQGRVEVKFNPVELRPTLELEPQKVMKSSRLKQDLSVGLITDFEYHMEMYGRPPPSGTPTLSGTNFLTPAVGVDASNVSPNSDPLGRSLAPEGGKSAKSNGAKAGGGGKTKLSMEFEL